MSKQYSKNPYWKVQRAHKKFAREVGIPFEELESWYKKQWMKQQAQCAICGVVFGEEVIDYDHVTGKLRGLLCSNCNSGIRYLKDDVAILAKAIEYINKNKVLKEPILTPGGYNSISQRP